MVCELHFNKAVLKKKIAENFQNLVKDINLDSRSSMNTQKDKLLNKATLRHILNYFKPKMGEILKTLSVLKRSSNRNFGG